jgi:tRNA nucleotidyltransferase (CCA-adding enzyme)
MAQKFWDLSPKEKLEWRKKIYDFGEGRRYEAGELPHINEMIDVPAGPEEHHPEKNQAIHNWLVYQKAKEISDNPKDWYAAALHDLGKVHTDKSIWPKQYSHEGLGVKPVEDLSTSLGVPEDWKEIAKLVAENHLLGHQGPQLTPKRIKKLFEDLKTPENVRSFLNAINADHGGRYGRELETHPNIGFFEEKYRDYLNPPSPATEKQKLALTSKDLMDLGYTGPALGKVKKDLENLIESNPQMNEREVLINYLNSSFNVPT